MKLRKVFLTCFLLILSVGCNSQAEQKIEQKNEFLEVRINRWTALEGGETLVLHKINEEWSARLLGDGSRFGCLYQESVQPKYGWEIFWLSLQKEGLLEIPDGNYADKGWLDGSGFVVEVYHQNKLKRYSFFVPEEMKTERETQILRIGDLINQEFGTPVFVADYDRGKVGEYLIGKCKDFRKSEEK